MNFNSRESLIRFLPVSFVGFYAASMRLRLWILVAVSFVFYVVSGLEVLLAFMILWGFGIAFFRKMAEAVSDRRRGLSADSNADNVQVFQFLHG